MNMLFCVFLFGVCHVDSAQFNCTKDCTNIITVYGCESATVTVYSIPDCLTCAFGANGIVACQPNTSTDANSSCQGTAQKFTGTIYKGFKLCDCNQKLVGNNIDRVEGFPSNNEEMGKLDPQGRNICNKKS